MFLLDEDKVYRFLECKKRELIKKTQKVIFEDSQEFLQKLFDIATKESIYISQKKIQAAPRQITITLFIIINKIVLLDIFVQLIR